jgi:hypothetical protein
MFLSFYLSVFLSFRLFIFPHLRHNIQGHGGSFELNSFKNIFAYRQFWVWVKKDRLS